MLVTAMADASAATNILLGVTQRLVARHALSWEDVQDIYDLILNPPDPSISYQEA